MGARLLLLALLAAASSQAANAMRVRERVRDFPHLADVILDVCGTGMFELKPSSPCQYYTLGFSMAWSECSSFHKTDFRGFAGCVGSCAHVDICRKVCGGGPVGATGHCYKECEVVANCVKQTLDGTTATGVVSAEREVATCFAAVPGKTAGASFMALSSPNQSSLLSKDSRSDDDVLPDFNVLFPVGCEVREHTRKKLDMVEEPNGHGSGPLSLPERPPTAPFFAAMRGLVQGRAASATTLPPEWHQAHLNAFLGSQAMQGPALPKAVETANLPGYFSGPATTAAPGAATNADQALKDAAAQPYKQPAKTKGWW